MYVVAPDQIASVPFKLPVHGSKWHTVRQKYWETLFLLLEVQLHRTFDRSLRSCCSLSH